MRVRMMFLVTCLYSTSQKKLQGDLTPEESRFLHRIITLGKRNGLHLAKEIQEVLNHSPSS